MYLRVYYIICFFVIFINYHWLNNKSATTQVYAITPVRTPTSSGIRNHRTANGMEGSKRNATAQVMVQVLA